MTAETSATMTPADAEELTFRRPSPRVVFIVLVSTTVVLALLDIAAWNTAIDTGERFSLDAESSLPTWWASVQFLLLALVFLLAASRERREARGTAARTLAIGAAVAVFFSLDEAARIHEGITKALIGTNIFPSFNGGHGIWIFVYGILAVVLLAVTLTGVVSLLRSDRTNTLLAGLGGGIFVLGGVVVEVVGYSMPSHAEVVIEEFLEFLGIAIMVWAVYRMLGSIGVRIRADETVGEHAQ